MMFGIGNKPTPPPRKPSAADFSARLDVVIADHLHLGDRAVAQILEDRAQALRTHWANTAPII